jgi:CHAT domain-containing protein/Tfp pilus assembly protein PilF
MAQENQDGGLIRRYLLCQLAEDELEQLEEKMMADNEFFRAVVLAEDEMVEEYVQGELPEGDRAEFEASFLSTPEGRQQVAYAKALSEYVNDVSSSPEGRQQVAYAKALSEYVNDVSSSPAAEEVGGRKDPVLRELVAKPLRAKEQLVGSAVADESLLDGKVSRPAWWRRPELVPYLRLAAAAVIVIGLGLGIWQIIPQSEVSKGLTALASAYREQRPVEARISGFDYAPAETTRGGEPKVDRTARNLAESVLLDAVLKHPNAATHHAAGQLYLAEKKFDEAIEQFEEALKADPNDAQLHSDYGAALLEKGRSLSSEPDGRGIEAFSQSLVHLNRALALDANFHAALFNRGILHEQLGLNEQARQDWEAYLKMDPNGHWADEARERLTRIGEHEHQIEQGQQDLAEEFLSAYRAADADRAWAILSPNREKLTKKLLAVFRKGSLEPSLTADRTPLDALAYAGQIDIQRVGDRFTADLARYYLTTSPTNLEAAAEAESLVSRADEMYAKAQLDGAIDLYTRAQRILAQIGDQCEAQVGMYRLGLTYLESTRTDQSAAAFGSLARESEADGYRWLQARALFYLSGVEFNRSEYSKALSSAGRARADAEKSHDLPCVLSAGSALIEYNRQLGNRFECFQEISRSLPLLQVAGFGPMSLGRFYGIAAMTFNTFGLHDAAIDYQMEALRYAEALGDFASLSVAHAHLGLMYGKLQNYDEAFKNVGLAYSQGQAHAGEPMGQEKMAYAALQMGNLHRETGNFVSALASYDRSIELYQELNFPTHLYQAYKGRLVCTIQRNDTASAQQQLADILKLMEKHRANIFEEENRDNFFDIEQSVYDLGIDFEYSRRQDLAKAFEYAEASRSRSLLDSMSEGVQVAGEGKSRDLPMRPLVEPYSLSEIQARVSDEARLVEFAVLDDKLLTFVISRSRLQMVEVKISHYDLTDKVNRYRSALEEWSDANREAAARLARELHEALIAPVEPLLEGSHTLHIVPDKVLNRVPWDALISSTGEYLVEDYLVTIAPSATLFAMCTDLADQKAGSRTEHLLSVGDPSFDRTAFSKLDRLADARSEAEGIARLYPSSAVLVGPAAREQEVRDDLARADVAQFAAHCVINERSPMWSTIVLAKEPVGDADPANDGQLQTGEICGLKLPHLRLAVLSACQTGVERYYRGEGMIGMARAFLVARVPVVVASLWAVDSKPTAELMIRFHEYRKRAGLPTAEALRRAKKDLLRGRAERYRQPYYWAAFQMIGGSARF